LQPRFVAVGDVMLDVVCSESPPPGSRVHAEVSVRAGGSAVNACAAAVAAGASATVIGRIGADRAGDLVLAEVGDRGIAPGLAHDAELPTGIAVALAGERGTAALVAQRGANARLSPADIPETIDADALFVSGFALFQSGSAPAAKAALQRFAGAWAGVDVSSPALAASAALDLEQAAVGANVILATVDEARALTGARPEPAARALASRFAIACVKLGEDGAIIAHGARLERRAVEARARRSPVGAGDAFAGALLVALANGDPPARALELACEAGADAAGQARW
jgi:sugar/nucleoside kinase (ribokinase family)